MIPVAAGVGLKPEHFSSALATTGMDLWFEVHPENYMIDGGPRLDGLIAVREQFPLSLHGIGTSIGGPLPPSHDHLKQLKRLVNLLEPAAISEHAVWSRDARQYYADLLPLPRTREAMKRLCDGIDKMQTALGRNILIENPANYVALVSEMDEPDFLVETARTTSAGLLVDVNNIYVSAHNCGIDARGYIDAIPPELVGEIHIAGHHVDENYPDQLLIDSHAAAVVAPVWDLLEYAIKTYGPKPILLERDADLPPFVELMVERDRAQGILTGIQEASIEQA